MDVYAELKCYKYMRKENSFTVGFVFLPGNGVCLGIEPVVGAGRFHLSCACFLILPVRSLSRTVMDFVYENKINY